MKMIKIIVLSIYAFGVGLGLFEFYNDRGFYKRFRNLGFIVKRIIEMIIWPIIWLKNFIEYYLYRSGDYRK